MSALEVSGSIAALVVAGGGLAVYGLVAPRSRLWAPVVCSGDRSAAPRVALTFDDGPTPESTPRILDTLAALNVKAAFFVVGEHAARWPDLVKRIDAEGHLIGNHSYDHAYLGTLRRTAYWTAQLQRTDCVIEEIIGKRPAMFRPPMGLKTGHVASAAARGGHAVITWSRRAFDGIATQPGRITHRLLPAARAGDILLLHDGRARASAQLEMAAVAAIGPLIAGLRERGLEPVRLDELTALPAYHRARN